MTKRNIKSFEPDADVAKMLDRAKENGIRLNHILNKAARQWLTAKGFSRKSDPVKPAFLAKEQVT